MLFIVFTVFEQFKIIPVYLNLISNFIYNDFTLIEWFHFVVHPIDTFYPPHP